MTIAHKRIVLAVRKDAVEARLEMIDQSTANSDSTRAINRQNADPSRSSKNSIKLYQFRDVTEPFQSYSPNQMSQPTSDRTWFSFSDAPIKEHDPQQLEALAGQPNPEKAFRGLGFLFDHARFAAKQPCLQRLGTTPAEANNSDSSTSLPNRSYEWDTVALVIQLRWQPGNPRKILVSATSYDDFPVATLIDAESLGPLPPAVEALLEQLKQELPTREMRYQQKRPPAKRPSNPTAAKPIVKPEPNSPEQSNSGIQISLF